MAYGTAGGSSPFARRVSHHAPAGSPPALPYRCGGAFGIPERMPPVRRQDFQRKRGSSSRGFPALEAVCLLFRIRKGQIMRKPYSLFFFCLFQQIQAASYCESPAAGWAAWNQGC